MLSKLRIMSCIRYIIEFNVESEKEIGLQRKCRKAFFCV